MSPLVVVLLACHNGEKYLADQLDSILCQEDVRVRIVAVSDTSTDDTEQILDQYAQANSGLTWFPARHGLALRAFEEAAQRGLEQSDATYFAFADQDDVWHPRKLISLLRAAGDMSTALVYSDMQVVDEALNILHPSNNRRHRLDTRRVRPSQVALKNLASGNTMLVHRCLLESALPFPSEAINHDWWMALVTSCLGKFIYVDDPLVLYRQHTNNLEGSKGFGWQRLVRELRLTARNPSDRLRAKKRQAQAILHRYEQHIPSSDRAALEAFAATSGGRIVRYRRMRRGGMTHNDLLRDIALFMLI